MDQHVDRPAPREHRVRERAHLRGVAHVRAQELCRPAGTADRLDRVRAPRLMVPDDEDFRPASRELDRREAPHPARRPREQHCLPFHARVHRDLLDKSYKVFSKLITVLPATLPLVTAYVALPLLSSNVRKSLVLFDLHVSSMQRSVKQLMATKEPATYT